MITSAPRSPNPDMDEGESSAPRKSVVIRLRIPLRRSTRLTPSTPIPTTAEADDIILQDTIQLSLAKQKRHDELEAKQNVQNVEEHLIAEEIEKLVEGTENVEKADAADSSTFRQNDNQNDPDTRLVSLVGLAGDPSTQRLRFIMDDPNITMEEYIILEEEKAQRHGRTFNWKTATYAKVKYCKDKDDCFTNFETEFPAIVFDDTLTSDATLSC
ncbi:hypothetical protein Tco_0853709 [Tanacetum coccineum]